MIQWIVDFLSWIALLGGIFFIIVGFIGLLRLPDFYTRLHAVSVIDTLGAALILLGLMLQAGLTLISFKLFLILLLWWFGSPTATHALARSALYDPEAPNPLFSPKEAPPSKLS